MAVEDNGTHGPKVETRPADRSDVIERGGYTPGRTVNLDTVPQPSPGPAPGGGPAPAASTPAPPAGSDE